MWLNNFCLFTLFVGLSANICVKENIQYEIVRYLPDHKKEKTYFNQEVIQNNKEALYINITGPVKAFCKGSLDFSVKIYHFWCDGKPLEEIEVGAFDNQKIFEQFRIRGGNLKIIKTGTFNNLNIRDMTIGSNKIKTIETHAIANMPNLTALSLDDNEISTLHPEGIINTPKLKWLYLSRNKLKIIGPNMFKYLPKIVGIGLDNNEFDEIDPQAFQGLIIYTIGLSNNKLKEIPEKLFTENQKLGEIYAENNQLTSLSDAFFTISTLRNVFLKGNNFSCDTILKLDELHTKGGFASNRRKRLSFDYPPILSYDRGDC